MEEENHITEYNKLANEFKSLKAKLNIAIQGLSALYSGGEATGIAKATLEEIERVDSKDLPQE